MAYKVLHNFDKEHLLLQPVSSPEGKEHDLIFGDFPQDSLGLYMTGVLSQSDE